MNPKPHINFAISDICLIWGPLNSKVGTKKPVIPHCASLNIHETRGDFLSAEFVANGGSVVVG